MKRQMKDSGIEWIGEIPKEWDISKTLYSLKMPITDGPHETPELLAEGIPFISAEAVSCGNGHIDFSHKRGYISREFYDECCKKYVPQLDDIYMIKSGATTGKIAKVETNEIFTIWSPLAVFRFNEYKANVNYMYFYLQSDCYQKQIEDKWTYGTQQNIGMRTLEQLKLVVPPLSEQQRIADFLDDKVSQIDSTITKTRESIEEYKKLKQSIITEAVTKGIRSNRRMKESGIKWVKSIPAEWDGIAPKALFALRKDKAQAGEKQLTASQQYGVIYQDEYMELTGTRIVTVEKDFDILKHVEAGDFVISMRSFQGGLEYSEKSGSISSAYVMLIPDLNLVYPRFYKWLFKSSVYINALQSTSNLVRDGQAMRYSNFVQVRLYTVPLEEQKEIAGYLDNKCAEIDTLIEKKTALLAEMEAYKKSVIYEYVTGKREV